MTGSQDGIDISRGDFRDALRWRLDILIQDPPLHVMAEATRFQRIQWITREVAIGGGLVVIRNNFLNKEWADMCRAAYALAAVTN